MADNLAENINDMFGQDIETFNTLPSEDYLYQDAATRYLTDKYGLPLDDFWKKAIHQGGSNTNFGNAVFDYLIKDISVLKEVNEDLGNEELIQKAEAKNGVISLARFKLFELNQRYLEQGAWTGIHNYNLGESIELLADKGYVRIQNVEDKNKFYIVPTEKFINIVWEKYKLLAKAFESLPIPIK